jgi:hypothetical protein
MAQNNNVAGILQAVCTATKEILIQMMAAEAAHHLKFGGPAGGSPVDSLHNVTQQRNNASLALQLADMIKEHGDRPAPDILTVEDGLGPPVFGYDDWNLELDRRYRILHADTPSAKDMKHQYIDDHMYIMYQKQRDIADWLVHRNTQPLVPVPSPVHVAPAPVHVAPAPVHVAPAPVHVAPAPVHVAPAPVHVAPVIPDRYAKLSTTEARRRMAQSAKDKKY